MTAARRNALARAAAPLVEKLDANRLERDVARDIRDLCKRMGLVCIRIQSGTARGGRTQLAPAGTPDILILLSGGRCVWVEAKRPKGGRFKPGQQPMHERLRVLGHTVVVAKSAQDVADALREARR